MDNYCRNCRHVRTATQLGCVSEMTKDDELFCGLRPPQVGDATIREEPKFTESSDTPPKPTYKTFRAEPVCLPACNEGKGYRGMACWTPPDGRVAVSLDETELDALLFSMRATVDLASRLEQADPPGMSTAFARVQGAFRWLRERT